MNNNWKTVKFGDVVRNMRDTERNPLDKGITRYVGLADLDPESIQLKRWGSLEEDETTFTRVFREGQMLFGRRRAYQRKAALAPFDGICSGDIIVMEAKPDKLLPELLPFLIHTDGFFNYAIKTSAGSLSPRTKWSHLAKYEFTLPPLDEQRRIAEILWAVEETFQSYSTVLDRTHALKCITVNNYVAKGIGKQHFKNSKYGEIPDDWVVTPLDAITDESKLRNTDSIFDAERVQSISNEIGFFPSDRTLPENLSRYKIVKSQSFAYNPMRLNVGSISLRRLDEALVSPDYVVFSCREDDILPEYFYYFCQSHIWSWLLETSGSGSIRTRYYYKDIARFKIPLPPISDQHQIIDALVTLDSNIETCLKHIDHLKQLRHSILENIYADELEVDSV